MDKTTLEVKKMSKSYPGVQALKDIDFEVQSGEVHVLIGENGAGKSTMGNIILGAQKPDGGKLLINKEELHFKEPRDALKYGIAGVNQELMLVPWLNVAQNIFLKREPRFSKVPFLIDHKEMRKSAEKVLASLGDVKINVNQSTKTMSAARKELIEIAKIMVIQPKIVIFDEPTAILSKEEVEKLFVEIEQLKRNGAAIVYISHRLSEVRQIGDRVTVLRDGKKVGTYSLDEVSDEELVKLMVGRHLSTLYQRNRREIGEEILRLENCSVVNGPKNVNMKIHEGEIVGLAGLVGSGRTELARAIFGVDKFESGELYLYGKKIPLNNHPSSMIARAVGLIPEDRKEIGLSLEHTVTQNMLISSLTKFFNFRYNKEKAAQISEEFAKKLRVVTPSMDRKVKQLSGGNQQKVVIGKWLATDSDFYIFDEPTKGIDVGAKTEVHQIMDDLVNNGAGILMISSDLPEVIGVSDRIYIMFQGEIVGEVDHTEANQENIAEIMLGTKLRGDVS